MYEPGIFTFNNPYLKCFRIPIMTGNFAGFVLHAEQINQIPN